ncbi:hypothetical protein DVH24_014734 [Malus domestica]|uniref:RING-type domain-containing protein n=1 Tax=Malus domestica TaxID=3750 RepID=A0A498K636_MALDO|nr:hypothetical protein DVH24_014734 [Malus domestica]
MFRVFYGRDEKIVKTIRKSKMRKSFKDSIKALEADIQFANTLISVSDVRLDVSKLPLDLVVVLVQTLTIWASDYPREYDGACLQMRLSYRPAAQFFWFLIRWTDCHLAGALGLLRILIYKAYEDGKTTMSIHEREASLKEFYGVIFPSLLQLQRGMTDVEDRKQKEILSAKYKRKNETDKGKLTEIDLEREEECGICMEMNSKVVLPNCSHSMCMKCYRNWRTRSQSCPFCRDSLKRVNSSDLWIYTSNSEIVDPSAISRENSKRLFMYIDKLPLIAPNPAFVSYDLRR